MKKSRTEIIEYINTLKGYQGYVQFSHRPIDKDKDIFIENALSVKDEDGFIYEAHFCNAKESVSIRQINDGWLVSTIDISNIDTKDIELYLSDIKGFNYSVKMAQIWKAEKDELCEGMEVLKLQKVVFAGFHNG